MSWFAATEYESMTAKKTANSMTLGRHRRTLLESDR
jgi:hypothetical protein